MKNQSSGQFSTSVDAALVTHFLPTFDKLESKNFNLPKDLSL